MPTNRFDRPAGILVGLEGIGLVGLAAWQVLALVAGDTGSPVSAIALIVLTVVGAAVVIAFAAAILRARSWGRSGGVVTQLLILAVALGAATGSFADGTTALVIAVPAVVVLVILVLAIRDSGRTADDDRAV